MLQELLDNQRLYTNHFFDDLDLCQAEKMVQKLLNCSGVIFFTGVGKSGFVAQKIAFTIVSTGTRAFYLSPTDAMHGDLGMVSENDTFVLFSKSGESDELMHLAAAVRKKGASLAAIVCNADSRLAKLCDIVMTLPLLSELCPFNMAPTTSTAAQLLFGDLLTVALMRHKNFGLEQYALNHPSGTIGKRMILKVEDLMIKGDKIPLCSPENLLKDILADLSDKRCGSILVVDKELKLQGIFTDGDLRRSLQLEGEKMLTWPISKLMNANPTSIQPDVLAWEALKMMEANPSRRFTCLPVIDSAMRVVGLLHIHDVIQRGL